MATPIPIQLVATKDTLYALLDDGRILARSESAPEWTDCHIPDRLLHMSSFTMRFAYVGVGNSVHEWAQETLIMAYTLDHALEKACVWAFGYADPGKILVEAVDAQGRKSKVITVRGVASFEERA